MKLFKKVASKAVRAVKQASFKNRQCITDAPSVIDDCNDKDLDLERALAQSALEAALAESESYARRPNGSISGNSQAFDDYVHVPEYPAPKIRRRKSSDGLHVIDEEEAQLLRAIQDSLVVNYATSGYSSLS